MFISYRKIYYLFSITLIVVSLFGLFKWGINLGIDFKGGVIMTLETNLSSNQIRQKISKLNLGETTIQSVGNKGISIKMKNIDETTHQKILKNLGKDIIEKGYRQVGPTVGKSLEKKSLLAIFLSIIGIILYVAWAFRKVSRIIPSWKYGLIAVLALFHDVIIVAGTFAFLGHFEQVSIGLPFVAAILTIFGYSVNDTIVVFDRIRENLLRRQVNDFAQLVNQSIKEIYVRSLNTSLTTLFVLFCLFIFGGATLHYFSLALIIGIAIGTYSSIFIASPLLVSWRGK
ncbi:MAG TPA: protein translocase subunit SecF [Candidatus Portnoybacteria bacterium]|nr:protein translocase subunit SecF [Candidatus Portnoybacteria bacterium]